MSRPSLGLLAHDGLLLFAVFAAYGIFLDATEGVEKARVADLAPADWQGTAFGWFKRNTGLMLLSASLVFGWLYQGFSALTAFAFSAGCALTAAALLRGWVGPARGR